MSQILTYTQTPNYFFDVLWSELPASQLRVLGYIIRHTAGYHKDSDAISYDQFISGVVARDGRIIDKGAGVSRRALVEALKVLEDKGLIKREHVVGQHTAVRYTVLFEQNGDNQPKQVQSNVVKETEQVQEDHPTKETNHESKEHDHAVQILLEIPDMTRGNAKRLADIALKQHRRDTAYIMALVAYVLGNGGIRVPAACVTALIKQNSAGYSRPQPNHIVDGRKKVRGGPDMNKFESGGKYAYLVAD